MKRITYLFFLFFLLHYSNQLHSQGIFFYYDKIVDSLSAQSDGGQLIENLTRQVWNQTSSSWVNDSLFEYSYNGNSLVDTLIAHKWRNGNVWGNDGRWRYIYNSNNKLSQRYRDVWAATYWRDDSRNNYSYSGPNQNLSQISLYIYSDNTWVLMSYKVYSWNANNYLINTISYVLSTIFPWYYEPTWKDEYFYDSTNVLIMKTGFDYVGCSWVNDINDFYFYDNIGNKTENIRQEWSSTSNIWSNDYCYLYEYDINNVLLSIVYQDWQQDSLDWENVWRETYTYTPQNKIATMFKETWTPESGWNNYVFRTYFYDTNSNWTEKLTQLWDGSNWNNYYRHLATWLVPVSVWETPHYLESYLLYNNYPNPFNPSTKIKFTIPSNVKREMSNIALRIYDVLGNEVTTLIDEEKPAGEYEIEFDGKGLPSGIYFYTLRSGAFCETKKMILLK